MEEKKVKTKHEMYYRSYKGMDNFEYSYWH